jgi:hypothetical protein
MTSAGVANAKDLIGASPSIEWDYSNYECGLWHSESHNMMDFFQAPKKHPIAYVPTWPSLKHTMTNENGDMIGRTRAFESPLFNKVICRQSKTQHQLNPFDHKLGWDWKHSSKRNHSEPAPTSAPWRMNDKWSGNNFLLSFSSLINHGS